MLGEEQTKLNAIKKDAKGLAENKDAAIEGGGAAGEALYAFEKRSKQKVVSGQNFKKQIEAAKEKKRLK